MPNRKVQALRKMISEQSKKCNETRGSFIRPITAIAPAEFDTVVLKNLDPNTDIHEIEYSLQKLGYKVISVRNAENPLTGTALPIFFVKLHKNPLNDSIYDIKYVAQQVVVIEEYLRAPDLPRCTRCQSLEHLKDTCKNPPICAWCSGGHFTATCVSTLKSLPKCSRCSGCHPSNYKGCMIYKQSMREAQKQMEAGKSATSSRSTPSPNSASSCTSPSSSTTLNTSSSNDSASNTSLSSSSSPSITTPKSSLSEGEFPVTKSTSSESEEGVTYPLNWTPPKGQLMSTESICKQLEDNLRHYFSMNEDLRVKLFQKDPFKENLDKQED